MNVQWKMLQCVISATGTPHVPILLALMIALVSMCTREMDAFVWVSPVHSYSVKDLVRCVCVEPGRFFFFD